jgi:hypothetical protein
MRLMLLAPGRAAFVLVSGRHVMETKALGRSCGLIPLGGPAGYLLPSSPAMASCHRFWRPLASLCACVLQCALARQCESQLGGSGRRVWTRGLEWNLDGREHSSLTFGLFISTSNRICPNVSPVPMSPDTMSPVPMSPVPTLEALHASPVTAQSLSPSSLQSQLSSPAPPPSLRLRPLCAYPTTHAQIRTGPYAYKDA